MLEGDKWSRWLAETRFGGDKKAAELQTRGLIRVRDTLLKKAGLAEGNVVLDVGAGEGLIGFGALEKVGASGRVIFSDISDACLEKTRAAAEQMGLLDQCSFVRASAEDLGAIESSSVDLVTTRSVLIYLNDKKRALAEFLRVLKPGGRTALFEPIDDRRLKQDADFWLRRAWVDRESEEGGAIADLLDRLDDYWQRRLYINEAMTNFNERDLVRMCVEVGFAGVHTEFHLHAGPTPPMSWDALKKSSGNPLIPTNEEAWREIFTEEEMRRFEQHLRPVVERGGGIWRWQSSFTWAFKAPIPEKPWPDSE
jgi:arsenite methyltransferase